MINGTLRDFAPLNKVFDEEYETTFLTLYKPKLKGVIDRKKIISVKEKYQKPILRPIKLVHRTYIFIKTIKKIKPDKVFAIHDDANTSLIPTILIRKKILQQQTPKFYLWIRTNPVANHSKKKSLLDKIVLISYKYFYKYADTILVQTEKNKKQLWIKYPSIKNKIKISPNIYHVTRNIELSKERINTNINNFIKNGDYTFVTVWRLTEAKGQRHLLRCFASLAKSAKNVKLIIIGAGELSKELKDLTCRLHIENKVMYTGNLENPFPVIAKSNCFLLSSLREGMPQVITEAISLNKIVIASDCDFWPREILCPEIGTDQKITYPYIGWYGILTAPFTIKGVMFKTEQEQALEEEEKTLVTAMNMVIEMRKNKKNIVKEWRKRAAEFDIHNKTVRNHIRSI